MEGAFHKDERNPLLIEGNFESPRKLWEPRFDNGYPNVIYDAEAKLYRLYYTLFIKDDSSLNNDREMRKKGSYTIAKRRTGLAYAQSTDGIHWEKPNLGLVDFEGSTENNLILTDVQGTGVLYDAHDSDENRRFKLITLRELKGKASLCVAFSKDGIHFSELLPWKAESQSPVPGGDCHNQVFIDPRSGQYVLITRLWDNGVRVSAISHSHDFLDWTPPKELHRGSGFNHQVYSMPVFPYHGLYLGLASIFHDGDESLKNYDTVDSELYWTTTLDRFIPVAPETDNIFIPHGNEGAGYPDGDFDSSVIFVAPPLVEKDKLVFYYMGGKGRHTGWRETALGRGYIEQDKFAYYAPRNPDEVCLLTTRGLKIASSHNIQLLLDIDDEKDCQVALYDRNGRKLITGFEAENSQLQQLENGWYQLSWQNAPYESLEEKAFYALQITLRKGKLWAIGGDIYPRPLKYTRHIV